MAMNKAQEQLVHEGFYLKGRARFAESVQIFSKITVKKLKNKVKFFFAMNHISELDNVGMPELLQHADLSESGSWHPIVQVFDSNLFYSHNFLRGCVSGLENGSVRACTKLLEEIKSEILRLYLNYLIEAVLLLWTVAFCY